MNVKWLVCTLLATALASTACSATEALSTAKDEQVTTFTKEKKQGAVVIRSTFGSSDIKNWRVLDNRNMVIETYSHGDFLATFTSPCSGLRFTETIGFSTLGPFELDKSTKVILPDGQRCYFKELKPYVAKEKPAKGDSPSENNAKEK
jgi:hypothetical protein